MNPTFAYAVGTTVALALLVMLVYQIRTLIRIQDFITRMDGTARFLESSRPQIGRILNDLEAQLSELRGITEKANRIAGSAESVTSDLHVAVQPIIAQVSDLAQTARHVRAAAVAVRAGVGAFRDHRGREGEDRGVAIEHDDES